MSDKVNHVSASSISAFKACPTRYRIGYVEALRETPEPAPFRFGTAWHRGLEILAAPVGTFLNDLGYPTASAECRLTDETRLEIAVECATSVYTTIPDYADPTEWAVEREIIANALAAYHWLYPPESNEYETVATELEFDLPLVNPETGHPTPNFRRVGVIDQVLRHKGAGRLLIGEHKSTSKAIDSGSTYWNRLRLDTQSKFYIVAARDLQTQSDLHLKNMTVRADSPIYGTTVSGLLHDVFHKPQISPKKLTQAESAEFVKTGEYCGQTFRVGVIRSAPSPIALLMVAVDADVAEIEPGKKEGTFAIRETPGMFGARLLQDMTTRPEFYFARREIAFTDQELLAFQYQVWALQKNMNEMERTGYWFQNEQQCEATFRCAYCPICYNNVDVYHGATPTGFKRLRVEEAERSETGGAE
jgi:hypothetical protein